MSRSEYLPNTNKFHRGVYTFQHDNTVQQQRRSEIYFPLYDNGRFRIDKKHDKNLVSLELRKKIDKVRQKHGNRFQNEYSKISNLLKK